MSCWEGNCISDPNAPTGNCIFGDEYNVYYAIPSSFAVLPQTVRKCRDVLNYLGTLGFSITIICGTFLQNVCCQTCASKKSLINIL